MLRKLVSIDSRIPNEKEINIFIEGILKREGFLTQRDYIDAQRFNVIAEKGREKGGGKESILFYGHVDTVPLYGKWDTDPFKLTKKGDKLFGLGAYDMKGGIATVLNSIHGVSGKYVKILFCVDEENLSQGAWTAVQKRHEWFDDVKIIITSEAGITKDKPNENQSYKLILGRRGRCVIAVDFTGISSQGSKPDLGLSALIEASKVATNSSRIKMRGHEKLGFESLFVRELTSNSTSLSVPDSAHLEFDIHTVPPDNSCEMKMRIENYVRSLVKKGILDKRTQFKVCIEERATPYLDPYVVSVKDIEVKNVLSLVKKRLGVVKPQYGLSVADENIFANETHRSILTISPCGGNAHSSNEWVSERSLDEIFSLYKELLETG
jgi:acetylornithine deacetylase/succinyl-diaminopimelate desuccinylase-like protein